MSFLRLFGLLVGLSGIFYSFVSYRGVSWRRNHFLISMLLSLAIFVASANPNVINFLPAMLNLEDSERGRLLALMLVSIILLIYLYIETRGKVVKNGRLFDDVIRKISEQGLPHDYQTYLKPIMVLIPAYNEAENLQKLLKRIPGQIDGLEVGCLVVDDGSNDETSRVVKENGCLVLRSLINRGQGSASRLGYDVLKKEDQVKVVVTLDADNQHNPDEIKAIIRPILSGQSQVVIGSRRLGSADKGSLFRASGVYLLTWLINFISGTKLTDCSSGFKAFSTEALKKIRLYEAQYQSTEVIIEAAKQGLMISEVPIHIASREFGESKKGTNWQYGYRFLKVIIKSWWR